MGRPQQTICHAYITTLTKLGFEHEKGQIREWMTIARDIPTWGTIVESRLGLPPALHESSRAVTDGRANDKINNDD
jgi:hypothetical protein